MDLLHFRLAHFLKAVVQVFDTTNKIMQVEKSLVYKLKSILMNLLSDVQDIFILSVINGSDECQLQTERHTQKDDELFIESATSAG